MSVYGHVMSIITVSPYTTTQPDTYPPKKTHLGSMMNHFFISFLLGVYQCYYTDTLVSCFVAIAVQLYCKQPPITA